MKTIKIACDVKDYADLDKLIIIQDNLKSLSVESYNKCKTEILETGFAFPISVWNDSGTYKVLGGTQRVRTLLKLREEGFIIPQVPIVITHAGNYKEARRRILQDASQYGKIDYQGLYEFMSDPMDLIDPGFLAKCFDLPNVNLPVFNEEYFLDKERGTEEEDKKEDNKEYSKNDFNSFNCSCPRCGFEFDN